MKQISLQATGVLDDLTHFIYATMLGFLLNVLYFAAHKYITEQWH